MKKHIRFLLSLALCAALIVPALATEPVVTYPIFTPRPAIATNNTIVVSNSADVPDAHVVRPAVYKIDGNNYFKLRDVAMLLRGSEKEFSVEYDDESKSVTITSGQPYAPLGSELTGAASDKAQAVFTNNTVFIDGEQVSLTVYKIDGANYFRLRDLAFALDFCVSYDDGTKTVYISGARGYPEEDIAAVSGEDE